MTDTAKSLQEFYADRSICFGCGPANPKGLHIRSFVRGEEVICDFTPEKHHEAFPGVLNGGIIGTLLDCHMNWTGAWGLMNRQKLETPPCTVTSEFSVQLRRPTPTNGPVHLSARVMDIQGDRAVIEGTLTAGGKVCATGRGTFVAVKEGHPAFHRW